MGVENLSIIAQLISTRLITWLTHWSLGVPVISYVVRYPPLGRGPWSRLSKSDIQALVPLPVSNLSVSLSSAPITHGCIPALRGSSPLSTFRPVVNDLLNNALRLDNELSALAASVSEQGTNKPIGTTKFFIKSQNSIACILSFVVQIQLKILHDIDKCVFLIVTKFGSDTTCHFSAVTE